MVICLDRGADLHMAQLMPLPLTVSCFSKFQIGFNFRPVSGQSHVQIPHHTLNVSLHYLVKNLCSAGDVSHKPGGRLPLLSARPAVTLKRAATNFAGW